VTAEIVRSSPLIGPKVPVHGLLVDIQTGNLEWLVNGYQTLRAESSRWNEVVQSAAQATDALKSMAGFDFGEMKFPSTKIIMPWPPCAIWFPAWILASSPVFDGTASRATQNNARKK